MPGDTVATIAADAYVLRMRVPERHARFIREGDRVLVGARGLEAAPEKLVEGRVRLVYPGTRPGPRRRRCRRHRPRRLLRRRTHAGVRLDGHAAGHRRARRAIVYKRFGISYVRVKDIGETVVVQPGLPTEDGIEILSGLKPGDVLLPAEPSP